MKSLGPILMLTWAITATGAPPTQAPPCCVQITIPDEAVATVDARFLSIAFDTAQIVGAPFWDDTHAAVDLSDPRLLAWSQALAPAYLRVGGTDADHVYYDMSEEPSSQPPAPYRWVLDGDDWDALYDFASASGHELFFTVNAGGGPRDAQGRWHDDQARALLTHVATHGQHVAVWELGNELNAYPLYHHVLPSAEQLASDAATLRDLSAELTPRTRIAAASPAYWPIVGEVNPVYPDFIRAGGEYVDIVTWHYYPQQSVRCPFRVRAASPTQMMRTSHLAEIDRWAQRVETLAAQNTHGAEVWLGETGNAQCGGEPGTSDTFASSLWWMDQLGRMARRGEKVSVRQTLVGSDYGLLDSETLQPRPDYWASVLYKQLMGQVVLDVQGASERESLRAYAQCTPQRAGVVTLLLVNVDPAEPTLVTLERKQPLEVYELTAPRLDDPTVLLNGEAVEQLSDLVPEAAYGASVYVPPASITFVVLPETIRDVCSPGRLRSDR